MRKGGRVSSGIVAFAFMGFLHVGAQSPASGGVRPPIPTELWSLSRCVQAALASHPDAKDARLAVQEARLKAADARAGMLPALNLDAAYVSTSSQGTQPDFVAANGPRERMMQATLSQVLLDPALPPLARAGKAQVESAAQDEASVRSEVAYGTVRGVAEVLLDREEEAILTAAWQQAETQADRVEALFKEGLKARVDAAQSRLLAFTLQKQVQQARGAVRAAEEALCILLGVRPLPPLAESLRSEGNLPEIPKEESAVETALSRRPELASALAAQKAAEERWRSARRAYWPKIKGQVTWGWDTLQSPTWADRGWQGAVFLSMPVFTSGTLGRERAFQQMEAQKAADQVERVSRHVQSEVVETLTAYKTASEQQEVSEKALETARQVAEMSRTAFAEGTLSSLELTAAEKALVQAQLEKAQTALKVDLSYWACAWVIGLPLPGAEPGPTPSQPEP